MFKKEKAIKIDKRFYLKEISNFCVNIGRSIVQATQKDTCSMQGQKTSIS